MVGWTLCWLLGGSFFFFQAEDGIRDLVRSRGLGDVYKRQALQQSEIDSKSMKSVASMLVLNRTCAMVPVGRSPCLLYTSDAADDLLCVDLGGRRILKKNTIIRTPTHNTI